MEFIWDMSDQLLPLHAGPIKGAFTVRRLYRDLIAGGCLVLCGFVAWTWMRVAQKGAPDAYIHWAFAIACATIILLLVLHFVFCWRHLLLVFEEGIVSRGLIGVTEICLEDVAEAEWLADGPGAVILKTNRGKLRILFSRYSRDASMHIVQFLRGRIPQSAQQEWSVFCLKIALPLRNPACGFQRTEVLFSRAQFDRVCFWLAFAELAFGVGDWQRVGFPGDWTITILPWVVTGLCWISARFFIPVQFVTKVTWFSVADFIGLLADDLVMGFRLIGLIFVCFAFLFNAPRGRDISEAVIVVATLVPFAHRNIKYWKKFRAWKKQDLENSEAAVREWDLLDQQEAVGRDGMELRVAFSRGVS